MTNTSTLSHQATNGAAKLAMLEDYSDFDVPKSEPSPNGTGENFHRRLELLHADQLDALPPIRHLDAGKEIPERSLTTVFGPSGAGKTAKVLNSAFGIAQERPVVYIAGEGASGFAARKIAWCLHHKKAPGQLYFIPRAVNFLDASEVSELIDLILPIKPALLVVDTLARCMVGGDENSAQAMGLLIAACDRVRFDVGCTVLLVHHTGKSGLSERGSSSLRAACDQMISIANDDGLIKVSCEKAKDSREFEPYYARLVPVETGRLTADGEPETACVILPSSDVIVTDSLSKTQLAVLEALSLEIFQTPGAKATQIKDYTGLAEKSMYRALSHLKRFGYITQADRGDPYYIATKGMKALDPTFGGNGLS